MHAYSNTEFQDPIPVITSTFQSSNVSSNRIKIHAINSTIRNRLLLQVIHFRKCSIRSSDLLELLFYTKKSYRILQLQFYNSTRVPIHPHTTYTCTITLQYIQRILHPESNSTCRRQRALRVLHSRGQRTFIPEKKFYA